MKRGMGLIEVIIGVTIISVGILGLVGTYYYYLKIMMHNTPNIQATYLLEEGIESMRLLRDQSWDNNIASLSPGVDYHLVFNTTTSKWSTTGSNVSLIDDQFDRVIVADEVFRDVGHNIVDAGVSGAALDASTTLITAKVSWFDGSTTTKTLSAYLTNVFGN